MRLKRKIREWVGQNLFVFYFTLSNFFNLNFFNLNFLKSLLWINDTKIQQSIMCKLTGSVYQIRLLSRPRFVSDFSWMLWELGMMSHETCQIVELTVFLPSKMWITSHFNVIFFPTNGEILLLMFG